MLDADIAYVAGLFDGEGSAGVYKITHHTGRDAGYSWWSPRLQITMYDPDPVLACAEILGGWFGEINPKDRDATGYRWQAQTWTAFEIAKKLLPWVRNKAKVRQLQEVITYYENRKCPECKQTLPKGQVVYCSLRCRRDAFNTRRRKWRKEAA